MYNVAVLIETALVATDAQQLVDLHAGLDDEVTYHLLMPEANAAAEVAATFQSLGSEDVLAAPVSPTETEELQDEIDHDVNNELRQSIAELTDAGAHATGTASQDDPIGALSSMVTDDHIDEAIVITRPHVVSEFFHLDWASRARRKLGVPTLHLIAGETIDEEVGGFGEGASLI